MTTSENRISQKFSDLKSQNRTGLVTFITACDPDENTAQEILNGLPAHGADIIELGMPFTDPMADGPAIQLANQRALEAGASMVKTLSMVQSFRKTDDKTPIILMGYYNPIYTYGTDRFISKALESGVDGLIIVDLPPEEKQELDEALRKNRLDLIRLVTPTTDLTRFETITDGAGGFLYYVSITGVTGTAKPNPEQLRPHLEQLRQNTDLPFAVGFGISSPEDAAAMAPIADAVVVGSAIVKSIGNIKNGSGTVDDVLQQVKQLSAALA